MVGTILWGESQGITQLCATNLLVAARSQVDRRAESGDGKQEIKGKLPHIEIAEESDTAFQTENGGENNENEVSEARGGDDDELLSFRHNGNVAWTIWEVFNTCYHGKGNHGEELNTRERHQT